MPYAHRTIPEIHKTVVRPVVAEVVKDILKVMRINNEMPIEYLGSMSNLIPRKASIDGATEEENIFTTGQRVTISVSDEYTDMNLLSEPILKQNAPLIFKDEAVKTFVYPVYHQREFSVDITLHAPDRVTVGRWLRNIKSRVSSLVVNSLHHVDYSYNIPIEIMVLLMDVHNRRERIAGYGDNTAEWFNKHFTKKFSFVVNQAGKGATPVIRESQIKVMGNYSFGMSTPKKERKSDMNGGWEISFTYKFWLDVPEEVVISFPLLVHQTLLDQKFIDYSLPEWVDVYRSNESYSEHVLSYFNSNRTIPHPLDINPGIPIPACDDWLRDIPQHKYFRDCFRILLIMEEGNTTLCNLAQLGDYAFTDLTLKYLRGTYNKIVGEYFRNVFHLSVWRWNNLQDFFEVKTTPDLDVLFTGPINMRDTYHLLIEIVTDLSTLTDDALRDLTEHWDFTNELIDKMYPGDYDKLTKDDIGNINKLKDILKEIDKDYDLLKYPSSLLPVTVGGFTIVAGDK